MSIINIACLKVYPLFPNYIKYATKEMFETNTNMLYSKKHQAEQLGLPNMCQPPTRNTLGQDNMSADNTTIKCCNHQCNEEAKVFLCFSSTTQLVYCKKCYWAFNAGLAAFKKAICPLCVTKIQSGQQEYENL